MHVYICMFFISIERKEGKSERLKCVIVCQQPIAVYDSVSCTNTTDILSLGVHTLKKYTRNHTHTQSERKREREREIGRERVIRIQNIHWYRAWFILHTNAHTNTCMHLFRIHLFFRFNYLAPNCEMKSQ